jgi:hypothetical protein
MDTTENIENTDSGTFDQDMGAAFVKHLMRMWSACGEKEQGESESIEDITAEMRGNEFDSPAFDRYALNSVRCLAKDWANRIEVAQKAYNKEVTELLKEVIECTCLHCDMQDACAEGEDGMSTTCNAVAKARHFIEQHSDPELNNDECPF